MNKQEFKQKQTELIEKEENLKKQIRELEREKEKVQESLRDLIKYPLHIKFYYSVTDYTTFNGDGYDVKTFEKYEDALKIFSKVHGCLDIGIEDAYTEKTIIHITLFED